MKINLLYERNNLQIRKLAVGNRLPFLRELKLVLGKDVCVCVCVCVCVQESSLDPQKAIPYMPKIATATLDACMNVLKCSLTTMKCP